MLAIKVQRNVLARRVLCGLVAAALGLCLGTSPLGQAHAQGLPLCPTVSPRNGKEALLIQQLLNNDICPQRQADGTIGPNAGPSDDQAQDRYSVQPSVGGAPTPPQNPQLQSQPQTQPQEELVPAPQPQIVPDPSLPKKWDWVHNTEMPIEVARQLEQNYEKEAELINEAYLYRFEDSIDLAFDFLGAAAGAINPHDFGTKGMDTPSTGEEIIQRWQSIGQLESQRQQLLADNNLVEPDSAKFFGAAAATPPSDAAPGQQAPFTVNVTDTTPQGASPPTHTVACGEESDGCVIDSVFYPDGYDGLHTVQCGDYTCHVDGGTFSRVGYPVDDNGTPLDANGNPINVGTSIDPGTAAIDGGPGMDSSCTDDAGGAACTDTSTMPADGDGAAPSDVDGGDSGEGD